MNLYLLFKTLHIISFTTWMAGLFYLPRLYIYHCQAKNNEMKETFKIMEYKLLKIIMNPSMILTFIFGFCLAYEAGINNLGKWFHLKLLLLIILASYHGLLAKYRKGFYKDENSHSEKFYRFINEIPSIILVVIVSLAVFKPF